MLLVTLKFFQNSYFYIAFFLFRLLFFSLVPSISATTQFLDKKNLFYIFIILATFCSPRRMTSSSLPPSVKIWEVEWQVLYDGHFHHFNKNYFRLIWHLTIQSKNAISCLICVRKFPREMMYFYGFFMISKLYLCFVQHQVVCSVSAEVVREGMIWGQQF